MNYKQGTSFDLGAESKLAYAIALDGQGNVYFPDMLNNRILKFAANGQLLTQWGAKGSGEGEFNLPTGIAIGTDGTVYIADSRNYRIEKFTSDGQYLGQWSVKDPDNPQLKSTAYIAVNSKNQLYVIRRSAPAFLQIFTTVGQHIGTWQVDLVEHDEIKSMALDSASNVYLIMSPNNRVKKFSPEGKLLADWQLDSPTAIAIRCCRSSLCRAVSAIHEASAQH